MRADIQNMVNEINKSLELLRQRMGWETVKHRLEEFNARVEDPDLWNDPENAQKLMRERQSLIDAVEGHDNMQTELNDSIELIELGEMEDDQDVIKDAEAAIEALVKTAAAKELEALLNGKRMQMTPSLRCIQAQGAPRAVTGPQCWRGCMYAGRKKAAIALKCNLKHRGRGRD